MGVVHLGLDESGRAVAVKVLRDHIAHDVEAQARLAREVATLSRIQHPGVAAIVDADVDGPRPYLVTRYVPGPSLDQYVRDAGPLQGPDLVRLARGLSDALQAMHAVGVVHRDLKPGNVLMLDGSPVLIDFGIAHVADDIRLTMTGLVMGTPGYLSPELLCGGEVTEATDWWGWAATLAFAAQGRPPFGRGPMDVVIHRVRSGECQLDGVDPRLRALLAAALHPDPMQRPERPLILRALEEYAHGGDTTQVMPAVAADSAGVTPSARDQAAAPQPTVPLQPGHAAGHPVAPPPMPESTASTRPQSVVSSTHPMPAATQAHQVAATSHLPALDDGGRDGDATYAGFGAPPSIPPAVPTIPPAVPLNDSQPGSPLGGRSDPALWLPSPPPRAASGFPPAVPPAPVAPVAPLAAPAPVSWSPPGPAPAGLDGQGTSPAGSGGPTNPGVAGGGPAQWAGNDPGQRLPVSPERRPGGDPRLGRQNRTGTLLAVLVTIAAVATLAPVVALLVGLVWSTLARTADRTVTSLTLKRFERGHRGSDLPMAVLGAPLQLIAAAASAVLGALLPMIVSVAAALSVAFVASSGGTQGMDIQGGLPLAAAALVAVLLSWWGAGGTSLRRGSRSLVRGLAPSGVGAVGVTAVLLATSAYVVYRSQSGAGQLIWWPLAGPPLTWLTGWF